MAHYNRVEFIPTASTANDKRGGLIMAGDSEMDEFLEDQDDQSIDDLYLIFHLDKEDYGIGIKNVTEIVGKQNVTRVPNMPDYVKGVINLRGQVIPVIDVRTRFGLPFREYDDRTCSVVINVNNLQFGVIVDVVDEVISIAPDKIAPPPNVSGNQASRFIKGMGRSDGSDKVKLLLDIERMIKEEDLNQIVNAAS